MQQKINKIIFTFFLKKKKIKKYIFLLKMTTKTNEYEEVKKYNLEECIVYFKANLLQEDYLNNLKEMSFNGEIDKNKIRNISWKIFLNLLSPDETFSDWIESLLKKREEYKIKCKQLLKPQKLQGDPLQGGIDTKSEDWKNYYIEKDMKNIIQLDLARTYQELNLFHDKKIIKMLSDILLVWSKENIDLGYKQGMNDLLSILFLGFYPFYFPNENKVPKENLIKFSSQIESAMKNAKDLYLFFNDENELEADLYYCFSNLMKKGMKDLYDLKENEQRKIDYKKYQLFENEWTRESKEEFQNPLLTRCALIINEKLKSLDEQLYQHFLNINLNIGIVLQRWLKCIFSREFEIKETLIFWDAIFANEDDNNYPLIFIDFIALAMIINIRKELFEGEQTECFTLLFKYPQQDNIVKIIKISERIKNSIILFKKKQKVSIHEILTGEKEPEENNKKESIIKNFISEENLLKVENTMKKGGEILTGAFQSMGGFLNKMQQKMMNKNNETVNVKIESPHEANEKLFEILRKYSGKMSKQDSRELSVVIDYLKGCYE